MVLRVEVPMDFGLELLGSPSHGNLTLELAPGLDPVMVNTAIMSYNSPVIYRHTTELHQNTVDVVEFSREAVICFSRVCYSGQLDELEMSLFRHVYKMSVVFKVTWLESRCVKLYEEFVRGIVKKEYSYSDFLVFYKEAEYASIHLKNEELLKICIDEVRNNTDKEQQFINEYIADINALSVKEVNVVCKFAEDSKKLLVEAIIKCLEKDRSSISENCNYILENVDLVSCLRHDSELLDKLQHSIDSVDNITKRDMTTNMKMLKQLYETLPKHPPAPAPTCVTPSNLFHSFQEIKSRKTIDDLISYVAYESRDPTFLTLMDGLISWTLDKNTPKNHNFSGFVAEIEKLKSEFGWHPLPYEYLKGLCSTASNSPWLHGIQSSESFISSHTTKKGYLTFHSKKVNVDLLFSSPGESSEYILKCKSNMGCTETGSCGILIRMFNHQVRKCKKRRFNKIQVCSVDETVDSEPGLHFHNELVSQNVHLCLYAVTCGLFVPLSWYGKPEYDDDNGLWRWGASNFSDEGDKVQQTMFGRSWALGRNGEVQLVAFIKIDK